MALTIAPFYNVQQVVGQGGSNLRSDVMLVQYMLFHICVSPTPHWDANHGSFSLLLLSKGPGALFPFTGEFTPDLAEWIAVFQDHGTRRGEGPMSIDGRINRAPVGWGKPMAARSGWYTIQAMNRLMWRFNSRSFAVLPTLSDVPPALAADLSRVQFTDFDGPER